VAPAPRRLPDADLRLFALEASAEFGKAVATALGAPLSAHEERAFEDGEHKTRPLVSVRNADVYVLHSLYGDAAETPNDKLCRLLFFVGALADSAAARVTVVAPYLCYSRKDRRTKPRDPVTTRYVATLLEAVGTSAVVTMDVHNPAAFQNAFRCRTEHLEAKGLLVAHLARRLPAGPVAIVSPDSGGIKRAQALRDSLALRISAPVNTAFMEKQRSAGEVSGERLFGDVAGSTVIILDDLIATGTTIARAAAACRAAGAQRVLAACTHGLFLGSAATTLAEAQLEELVVTSTVPAFRLAASAIRERLTVLDCAPLFAEAIRRMHEGGSIVDLLETS
jgi:ribose-phosphate pyrophosphokinase